MYENIYTALHILKEIFLFEKFARIESKAIKDISPCDFESSLAIGTSGDKPYSSHKLG